VRHGGRNGSGFDYRVYGKAFSRAPQFHEGTADHDDWSAVQFGRAGWVEGDRTLTAQGDLYTSDAGRRIHANTLEPVAAYERSSPRHVVSLQKDLLHPRHAELELGHDPRVVVQIRRSTYVQLTWRR
jgi:hypothetical protein